MLSASGPGLPVIDAITVHHLNAPSQEAVGHGTHHRSMKTEDLPQVCLPTPALFRTPPPLPGGISRSKRVQIRGMEAKQGPPRPKSDNHSKHDLHSVEKNMTWPPLWPVRFCLPEPHLNTLCVVVMAAIVQQGKGAISVCGIV